MPSPSLLEPLALGHECLLREGNWGGADGDRQVYWPMEVRTLEKVSVSAREAGREAELHIHSATQQTLSGAFQGAVCLRTVPAALPEPPPPSSPGSV